MGCVPAPASFKLMFENTVTGTPAPPPPTALLKNSALHTTTNNTTRQDKITQNKTRHEICERCGGM